MNLSRYFLLIIFHSRSKNERNREFDYSVSHRIMYVTVVCLICSMKFFVIVTDRDITETNSLNFKIHLRAEYLGYILIYALNIAAFYYSRLVKIKDTKDKLSYTYHSEVRIEN